MANIVNVAGLAAIKVNTGGGSALELLGYSRDGVSIAYQQFTIPVPGDENGGDAGPPIDEQYLGEIALIRMVLSKFDMAILKKVESRIRNGAWGVPGSAGTLRLNTTNSYRLVIHTPTDPRNFPLAVPTGALETNKGTKYSEAILEWTAYKNASGILVDETTS
ncbi:MAG: hypothetical protein AB7U73_01315 [Pirellulales bacterium]